MGKNYVPRKTYETIDGGELRQLCSEKREKLALLTHNEFDEGDVPWEREKLIEKLMNTDLAFTIYETAEDLKGVAEKLF